MTESDWELLDKVVVLKTPFETATKFAEAEDCTISTVVPMVKKVKLEINMIKYRGIGTLRQCLLEKLNWFVRFNLSL